MKGLAKLICLMTLVGVTACQEVAPTSRTSDSAANSTPTSTTVESLPKSKSVDLDYSQEPEPKVTVSFNPVEIAVNIWRGLDQLVAAANRTTDAVQSLTGEKAEAVEREADSAKQVEQESDNVKATENSLPPVDELYTYHNAQPDPNLPPVEAIPCDDPRIVSNPEQVCQFRPGVIRMPRLDQ